MARLNTHPCTFFSRYTEMCLDRNYVCIGVVQKMFSKHSLFLCLQCAELHPSVRAECCRLLLHAYVDIQPQEEVTVAERPRLWSALLEKPTLPQQRFRNQLGPDDVKLFADLRDFLIRFVVQYVVVIACIVCCHSRCACCFSEASVS